MDALEKRLVAECARDARPPELADEVTHCAHLWVIGMGWRGYFGDALRKFLYESGPVSRQRWLHAERRFRTSTSVTEVVDKSVAVRPHGGSAQGPRGRPNIAPRHN